MKKRIVIGVFLVVSLAQASPVRMSDQLREAIGDFSGKVPDLKPEICLDEKDELSQVEEKIKELQAIEDKKMKHRKQLIRKRISKAKETKKNFLKKLEQLDAVIQNVEASVALQYAQGHEDEHGNWIWDQPPRTIQKNSKIEKIRNQLMKAIHSDSSNDIVFLSSFLTKQLSDISKNFSENFTIQKIIEDLNEQVRKSDFNLDMILLRLDEFGFFKSIKHSSTKRIEKETIELLSEEIKKELSLLSVEKNSAKAKLMLCFYFHENKNNPKSANKKLKETSSDVGEKQLIDSEQAHSAK